MNAKLNHILGSAESKNGLRARIHWLENLVEWVRSGKPNVRLEILLSTLEHRPEWASSSAVLILSILSETSSTRLLSETGVPSWTSLSSEFLSRLLKNIFIGTLEESAELKNVLEKVFYRAGGSEWLSQIPLPILVRLFAWLELGKSALGTDFADRSVKELLNASIILSMKSAAITVRQDFSNRSLSCPDYSTHPLLRVQQSLMNLLNSNLTEDEIRWQLANIERELNLADQFSTELSEHMETHGVSVDLCFQKERLQVFAERVRILLVLVRARMLRENHLQLLSFQFLVLMVKGIANDRDAVALLKKNFALTAKKIIDFTGRTGEDYIARTREDYSHLFWYAMGGGALTAVTVFLKYLSDQRDWPLFISAYYSFLNFSLSFLLMHFLHFKLATKQPSMTAAAFALKLGEESGSDEPFLEEISRIVRSQFASVLGNLLAVVPVALVIDLGYTQITGSHYVDQAKATHILRSLSPWHSLTILYAGMTGVLLWLSGLTSGWIQNGTVFYRVPELIRSNRMFRNLLGVKATRKIADACLRNVSGIASAISLGFYLAFWPAIGTFFGLPFDVRHVTLSTGSVAMAVSSLGVDSLGLGQWVEIILGISVIGIMNFGVSFTLALMTAVRAKGLNGRRTLNLFKRALTLKEVE